MPRLLKKIEANIISLFANSASGNFTAPVYLIHTVTGKVGVEDYIKLAAFEAFTQDFSMVVEASFCVSTPILYGLPNCSVYTELNISY